MRIIRLLSTVFTYSTVRHARIQSLWVGIIYRLAQLGILCYIVIIGLILKKGYQSTEDVSSIVTTKVKGLGYVSTTNQPSNQPNLTDPFFYENLNKIDPNLEYRIFDTADYVIPAQEYNSIFIMTNFIEIEQEHKDCEVTSKACPKYARAWFPEEDSEKKDENFIRNSNNFTIFIKNDIEFIKFNIKQRNIFKNMTNDYISYCRYDEIKEPLCPVFNLEYILAKVEPDKFERYQMLFKGSVIEININWDCNLDFRSICYPKYSFKRFDLKFKEASASSGFNFRYSNKFRVNGTDHRIMYKAYGLRFYINVFGKAGKFDIIPLMIKIGAGLGLMSVTFVIADCVMLYCPCASRKERKYYKRIKRLNAKNVLEQKLNRGESVDLKEFVIKT